MLNQQKDLPQKLGKTPKMIAYGTLMLIKGDQF